MRHLASIPRAAFAVLFLLAALAPASAATSVLVVDPGAGPFTQIQDAVNAAADGDVILVKNGSYTAVTVDNKGVSIVADTGSPTLRPVIARVTIKNLSASRRVLLRGFRIAIVPTPFGTNIGVLLDSNFEDVLLENCVLLGGLPSVQVTNSTRATLVRCAVGGSPAVKATGSVVHLFEGACAGDDGADATSTPFGVIQAGPGAAGFECEGSSLVNFHGTPLTGGDGGDGLFSGGNCHPGADGGPGLLLASGVVFLRDVPIAGGAGGAPGSGCGNGGNPGPAIDQQGGSVLTSAESKRVLSIGSPVREGNATTLSMSGVPGDSVFLLLSIDADAQFIGNFRGTLVAASPFLLVGPIGTLPPSGDLSINVGIPPNLLAPGVEGLEAVLQMIVPVSPGSGAAIGSPSVLTVVDPAF